MKSIASLQHDIFIYSKRLKSNFEAHKKRQKKIRTKLKSWENSLKEQIKIREELKTIAKSIKFDTGIDVSKKRVTKSKGEKSSFYKVALESGIKGTIIAEFAGVGNRIPAQGRKKLNKSLKNPTVKRNYENVKKMINE